MCGEVFKTWKPLITHRRTHSDPTSPVDLSRTKGGKGRHYCDLCDARPGSRKHLKEHMKQHHPEENPDDPDVLDHPEEVEDHPVAGRKRRRVEVEEEVDEEQERIYIIEGKIFKYLFLTQY